MICLIFLTACVQDNRMVGATCESSTQSKKDGVFLASYHIEPKHLEVGNNFYLEIKEAFIEQRFLIRPSTGEIRLEDPSLITPRLVLVCSDDTHLGIGTVDWSMEITDPDLIREGEKFSLANEPGKNVFAFDLKKSYKFIPKPFEITVEVRNSSITKKTRYFKLKAYPKK